MAWRRAGCSRRTAPPADRDRIWCGRLRAAPAGRRTPPPCWQATQVGVGLQHPSGGTALIRATPSRPALAMPPQIVRHLAPAGGMADVDGLPQIEMLGQGGQVGRVVIHVVAVAGLGGAAVAAAVMGDHPIAVSQEEQHLGVPIVGRQGPAVAEDDRLTRSPVLVEDLDAVFCRDGGAWTPSPAQPPPNLPIRRLGGILNYGPRAGLSRRIPGWRGTMFR